MFGAP
jgi:(R)-2-hydroxyglutarate---pyruvate transhydrogenase